MFYSISKVSSLTSYDAGFSLRLGQGHSPPIRLFKLYKQIGTHNSFSFARPSPLQPFLHELDHLELPLCLGQMHAPTPFVQLIDFADADVLTYLGNLHYLGLEATALFLVVVVGLELSSGTVLLLRLGF